MDSGRDNPAAKGQTLQKPAAQADQISQYQTDITFHHVDRQFAHLRNVNFQLTAQLQYTTQSLQSLGKQLGESKTESVLLEAELEAVKAAKVNIEIQLSAAVTEVINLKRQVVALGHFIEHPQSSNPLRVKQTVDTPIISKNLPQPEPFIEHPQSSNPLRVKRTIDTPTIPKSLPQPEPTMPSATDESFARFQRNLACKFSPHGVEPCTRALL